MESHSFHLVPHAPYAFDHILDSMRLSRTAVLERISEDDEYRRAVYLADQPALLAVRSQGTVTEPCLNVTFFAEHIDAKTVAEARNKVDRIFAVSSDIAGFEETIARDPVLWRRWEHYRGLRPLVLPDLFETIAWAIIGQQITVSFAAKCKRALAEAYGELLNADGEDYRLFPRPKVVADLEEADLLALQFSRQKARYVLNLARRVVSGEFAIDALPTLPTEEALQQLMTLVGVGRWTAEYVLLRGLCRLDTLPAGDVALQRVIGQAYLGRPATEAEVRALAEEWTPWRGLAAACWWYSRRLE